MATITLPKFTLNGLILEKFEIRDLNFAAPILDQGKGARRTWRERVHDLKFTAYESDAVKIWNSEREGWGTIAPGLPLHGIREAHRARMEKRVAAFASARAQVSGLIIPDEHDPRL